MCQSDCLNEMLISRFLAHLKISKTLKTNEHECYTVSIYFRKVSGDSRSRKQTSHGRSDTHQQFGGCFHGEDPDRLQFSGTLMPWTSGVNQGARRTVSKEGLSRTASSTPTKRGSLRMTLGESISRSSPPPGRQFGWPRDQS